MSQWNIKPLLNQNKEGYCLLWHLNQWCYLYGEDQGNTTNQS